MDSNNNTAFGRVAATYGVIAGVLTIIMIITAMESDSEIASTSMWFGYLVMLITLSLVFVGMKRYRDLEHGGVIRFWKALGLGVSIAAIAGLVYVLVWEAYLAATDHAFMDDYAAHLIEGYEAEGLSGAALAAKIEELEQVKVMYGKPWLRVLFTFSEIFPVGLLVSLVSAALLRKPSFLPVQRRPGA